MNITKAEYDRLQTEIEGLQQAHMHTRDKNLVLEKKILNFDEILDKIVRASNGVPLMQSDVGAFGSLNVPAHYDNGSHRCTPFTPEEMRQGELEGLREQTMMFAEQLAAVRAIATFAKEHKA